MILVEHIWTSAPNRHQYDNPHCNQRYLRRPSAGITAVLLALSDEPVHGGDVARRAGQDQGNTARWLPKLERFGFVILVDTVPAGQVKAGKAAGGKPAGLWRLTARGHELVAALRAEGQAA